MAPDEPDQTTPGVEPTPEPTPSPSVEAAPEQEPVGGEILVKRGSESEIDRGNVAAKCNKQARRAPQRMRQRIARALCHRASGERGGHCNSPLYSFSLRAKSTAFQKETRGQDTLARTFRLAVQRMDARPERTEAT